MSPEQVRGQTLDERTDIYSAGTVLYELATGKRPYPEKGGAPLISAILERPVPAPSSVNPRISPALEAIIVKATDKDPKRRYQTARELCVDLERLHSGPILVPPTPKPVWPWIAAVAALLIAVLFLANPGNWRGRLLHPSGGSNPPTAAAPVHPRQSVAVLGFKNLSGKPDDEWLSTAMEEMLTTELAAGGKIRTVPGENVVRMKLDLSLADADSYSQETLARIREHVGSDLVVLGSYFASGQDLRVDFRVQDATAGETIDSFSDTGKRTDLLELVSRSGKRLRERLNIGDATETEQAEVGASIPANSEAAKLYAEGLAKLRVFETQQARDLLQKAVAADPKHALAHSALATAWQGLGYDAKKAEEAKKAFELSSNLPREDKLSIEALYRESIHDWNNAVSIYRTLYDFFPDDLDYGLRLAHAQSNTGQGKDGLETLNRLRQLPAPAGDDPRIDLTETSIAESLGDFHRELAAAERAVAKGMRQNARLLVARAQLSQAGAYQDVGEPDKAEAPLRAAQQTFSQVGDQQGVARALNQLGIVLRHQGKLNDARKALQESLNIAEKIGDKRGMANAYNNLGNVISDQGDLKGSVPLYQQAVEIQRETGDLGLAAAGLNNLAGSLTQQGNLSAAGDKYRESLRMAREVDDKDTIGRALVNLADLQTRQGDLAGARKTAEDSLTAVQETGDQSLAGYARYTLGNVLFAQGELDDARKRYEEAMSVREKVGEKITMSETAIALAEVDLEEGNAAKAETAAREAAEVFRTEKVPDDEALALALEARALAAQGKAEEAQKAVDRARQAATKSQDPSVGMMISLAAARAALADPKTKPTVAADLAAKLALTARKYGYGPEEYEARLVGAEAAMKANPAQGRNQIAALEKEARSKGYLLVARKAERAKS
jgi:tetratricopeptide (TPR) repeat protein